MVQLIKPALRLKIMIVLFISLLFLTTGCDQSTETNRNNDEKLFDVRLEMWEGGETGFEIWKNVSKIEHDEVDRHYSFYVDGKLVIIDSDIYSKIIISEVGVNSVFSSKKDKYQGKLYDLSVYNGAEMLKSWNNVKVIQFNSDKIEITHNGNEVSILRSANSTTILNEVIDPDDPDNLFE